jgi:hypothetical protein
MTGIPPSIDDAFRRLQHELTRLYASWSTWRHLYAHSEKRTHLLNTCTPSVFYLVHLAPVYQIQMGLSRLTGRASTTHHKNLTVENLHSRVAACGDQNLTVLLEPLLGELHHRCQAIRLHRNKRLAHLHLDTALELSREPLPRITRKTIDDARVAASAYLHIIEAHYCNSTTHYEHFMLGRGADGLVATFHLDLRRDGLYKKTHIPWNDMSNSRWNDSRNTLPSDGCPRSVTSTTCQIKRYSS